MNLEKYKWKSRILFVSTPNYKEKKYLNLKKIYQDRIKEFHKRHIKLICKTNKKSNFLINLIGFDGKSKKKLDKLDYKLVFNLILFSSRWAANWTPWSCGSEISSRSK